MHYLTTKYNGMKMTKDFLFSRDLIAFTATCQKACSLIFNFAQLMRLI